MFGWGVGNASTALFSVPDSGTIFGSTTPRSPDALAFNRKPPVHQKTILLIEDDADSREVYGAVLRHSGYRILEAKNGEEGISLARQHGPDLIVMDLGLPLLDGLQATEVLKSDPATRGIPVVAMSVHVQEFYRGRAGAVGCESFLDKPCEPKRLVGEVARVLQSPP